ncbi:MAG: flagellar basal body rod protein FlgC [Acetobacteraceae bacterium]|nr:flagellar basal body rod protein FlgC [Acetobacteraceae bacterium]
MDLTTTLDLSAKGMSAQTTRLRVIAENLANSATTGSTPGSDPYRRKTVIFANTLDQSLNATTVGVRQVVPDMSAFPQRFDPGNPAADAQGYVKTPNVSSFVEVMDMKEAERSYSANLNVMETTRGIISRTVDLLR